MVQGTRKADWQEDFSNGTDPPAQASTREEVAKIVPNLPLTQSKGQPLTLLITELLNKAVLS